MTGMFGRLAGIVAVVAVLWSVVGCMPKGVRPRGDTIQPVPPPIHLLLPKTLEIHSFTQIETFEQGQGGIRARIKARDAYGDGTKAFGRFRFELYAFQPQNQNRKGNRLADWEVDVSQPEQNLVYWDRHTGCYEFKLGWDQAASAGQRLVLIAMFTSDFTPRLTVEQEIVAGQ